MSSFGRSPSSGGTLYIIYFYSSRLYYTMGFWRIRGWGPFNMPVCASTRQYAPVRDKMVSISG